MCKCTTFSVSSPLLWDIWVLSSSCLLLKKSCYENSKACVLDFYSFCCYVFPFLILLIWILILYPVVILAKGLSILLIFSKNQLLVWLILCMVLFVSILLLSAQILFLSCPLLLGEFASFCSRAFRCAVKLQVYALCRFFFWLQSEL